MLISAACLSPLNVRVDGFRLVVSLSNNPEIGKRVISLEKRFKGPYLPMSYLTCGSFMHLCIFYFTIISFVNISIFIM